MKNILILTTVSGFLKKFEMENVAILQKLGYTVHYAANMNEQHYPFDEEELQKAGVNLHHIDIARSPYMLNYNLKAFGQLISIIKKYHICAIHCHTPVGGMLGRMMGWYFHKKHLKVIYTAHELKAGTVQAILLNDAYAGIVAGIENYNWVATDLRKITEVAHVIDVESEESVPEDVPETFVMYLSGIDTYGGVSVRSRSDVNILAVVNTKTKNILLLSTPRDSYVEFNETGGAKDKLTHAGIYGVEASMNALERLYDVQVDYYLRIKFSGFVDIIDALGGVDVNSDFEFTVDPIKTYTVGMNHLTGLEALAFARERYSFADGDYQRAKNQMEVIRAVIQKCASSSLLKNYGDVMDAVAGSFETNMPQEQIATLVKMQLSDMAQWSVSSYTTGGTSMYAETFSMPGQELYVIELNLVAIEEAKRLIQTIYEK